LQEERRDRAAQRQQDRVCGFGKLALLILGIFFLVRFVHELHGLTPLVITCAVFIALAILHESVLTKIRKIDALIAFYERGLARLEHRWAGTGEGGEQFIDESHPYSRDLDLFGPGSAFELLCTFRTRAGQETLARWLLEPASPDEVQIRQRAVQELISRSRFREELFTAGNKIRPGLHPDLLADWAEQKCSIESRTVPVLAIALAILWTASVVVATATTLYWPAVLMSLVNIAVNRSLSKRLKGSASDSEAAAVDLELLVSVLRIIEKEHFSSDRLRDVQKSLAAGKTAASALIKRLDRIARFLEHRRNMIIKFFDLFIFYTVLSTLKIESWRRQFGPMIRTWLDAVGEVESIAALSCYAFEHPDDAWPEFRADGPLFKRKCWRIRCCRKARRCGMT
jgi:hypothetical protein